MNWEETITYIRTKPEFRQLIESSYFEENLPLNVERFMAGDEFKETTNLLKKYSPGCKTLLDIGSGNGISAIAFALSGYQVMSIEPDPSDTIGAGAIRILKEHFQLDNVIVKEAYAEELDLPTESFDVVYARQCMHHAFDLAKFVGEMSRVLKKGGVLFTIRDHVIFNPRDKKAFLQLHPLHKFYHGENAYRSSEYRTAFTKAGLTLLKEIKYYESVINYFPQTAGEIIKFKRDFFRNLKGSLKSKIGILADFPLVFQLYKIKNGFTGNAEEIFEKAIPGRMYSYILKKN